jgi:hypothetical protein
MTKYYLLFGFIAGGLGTLSDYLLFSGAIPFSNSGVVLITKLFILLLCIIFSSILIKKMQGSISFLRTTFGGLMVALLCTAINLAGYAYMAYPDYSFFENVMEYSQAVRKEQYEELPDTLPDKKKIEDMDFEEETRAFFRVENMAKFLILGYVAAGLIISVLLSAFISDPKTLS